MDPCGDLFGLFQSEDYADLEIACAGGVGATGCETGMSIDSSYASRYLRAASGHFDLVSAPL